MKKKGEYYEFKIYRASPNHTFQLKKAGISIKFMSLKTQITESTLYAFSCGARELSKEKAEKLEILLDTLLAL